MCRQGPWHYPEDQISDAPLRQLAAEITREKLYLRLHQELPYQSTVETEDWKERKDGSVRIEQTIYVERESQRKIVLGKGGQTIKAIGAAARARDRRDASSSRCTCFCSSRCAKAGATTRSATARWAWSFREGLDRRRRCVTDSPNGHRRTVIAIGTGDQLHHGMDRRRHRARRQAPRRGERHPRIDDARARPPSRSGARRRGSRLRADAAAGQLASRATWRARLDEHLGHYVVEGMRAARRLRSSPRRMRSTG